MKQSSMKRISTIGANAFILMMVYVMAFWSLPDSNFRTFMVGPIRSVVLYTGIAQPCDLFAPRPIMLNARIEARLRTRDGRMLFWHAPKSDELGFMGSLRQEQHHKILEHLRQDQFSDNWSDLAKYIARQIAVRNGLPMDSHSVYGIELFRQWADVPEPASGDSQPIPPHYPLLSEYRFYRAEITL